MSNGYVSPISGPAASAVPLDAVAQQSPRQKALESFRELPRDLMGGTDAMRAAGKRYIPQHPAESEASYDMRVKATTLYGAFSKAVKTQSGKLFMQPVQLVDASDPIIEFANDVDGEGTTLTAFANSAVREGFVDGISYLLVDFPEVPEGATQADVLLMRARPYWVLIRAQQVLGWRSFAYRGKQYLQQFRFHEEVEEEISEFETELVPQVRVLDIGGFWRVYRKVSQTQSGREDWALYDQGRASWEEIPVEPIYVNRCGYFEGMPPLRELAELNCEHWISSSEQRRALSYLRFAMLKIIGRSTGQKGAAKRDVEIAPDKVIELPAGGDAGYVEHSGAGIAAGRQDLQDIETRMQSTGMELRIENAGDVTATASAIDSSESNAALRAVAKGIEASLNSALLRTGEFLRVPSVGVAKINDEFAEPAPGDTNAVLALYGAGLLSRETTWDELIRRHVLDDDFDPSTEVARIASDQVEQATLLQGTALSLEAPGQVPAEAK